MLYKISLSNARLKKDNQPTIITVPAETPEAAVTLACEIHWANYKNFSMEYIAAVSVGNQEIGQWNVSMRGFVDKIEKV